MRINVANHGSRTRIRASSRCRTHLRAGAARRVRRAARAWALCLVQREPWSMQHRSHRAFGAGRTAGARRGMTLVEVLVSFLLLSLFATGLLRQLTVAHQTRFASANWMRATQLAAERMERIRAGDLGDDGAPLGRFTRRWARQPMPGWQGLSKVTVTVEWEDRGHHSYELVSLVGGER